MRIKIIFYTKPIEEYHSNIRHDENLEKGNKNTTATVQYNSRFTKIISYIETNLAEEKLPHPTGRVSSHRIVREVREIYFQMRLLEYKINICRNNPIMERMHGLTK